MAQTEQGTKASSFLGIGFGVTYLFCFLRDRVLTAMPASFSPMFVALGYTTGPTIIVPLLVGLLSRYLVLPVVNNHALHLPFHFFKPIDFTSFLTAFCCGLVVSEISVGLFHVAQRGVACARNGSSKSWGLLRSQRALMRACTKDRLKILQILFFIAISSLVLCWANFSFLAQGVFLLLVVVE